MEIRVTIIAGPNGSGKTTKAKQIAKKFDSKQVLERELIHFVSLLNDKEFKETIVHGFKVIVVEICSVTDIKLICLLFQEITSGKHGINADSPIELIFTTQDDIGDHFYDPFFQKQNGEDVFDDRLTIYSNY